MPIFFPPIPLGAAPDQSSGLVTARQVLAPLPLNSENGRITNFFERRMMSPRMTQPTGLPAKSLSRSRIAVLYASLPLGVISAIVGQDILRRFHGRRDALILPGGDVAVAVCAVGPFRGDVAVPVRDVPRLGGDVSIDRGLAAGVGGGDAVVELAVFPIRSGRQHRGCGDRSC